MRLRLLAFAVWLLASPPAIAQELPSDIARDLEATAAELDESLRCLTRDEALKTELAWIVADLRFDALQCALRGCDVYADRISGGARKLERVAATRSELCRVCDELTFDLDFRRLGPRRTARRAEANRP